VSEPKEIYLQPECCADPDVGRLWCEHDAPVDCDDGIPWTRYVLADQPDELPPLPPDTADIWCKHGVQIAVHRHCQACADDRPPDPQSHTTCEEVVGLLPKCVMVDCERLGEPLMCAEHTAVHVYPDGSYEGPDGSVQWIPDKPTEGV
jgi:hypothetical protein